MTNLLSIEAKYVGSKKQPFGKRINNQLRKIKLENIAFPEKQRTNM